VRYAVHLAAVLLIVSATFADEVVLKDGGRIKGTVTSEDDEQVTINTAAGGFAFDRDKVENIIYERLPAQVFEEELSAIADDDVDALLKLAAWCRRSRLRTQERAVYELVIEADADNEVARTALGYVFHEGRWLTVADFRKLADIETEEHPEVQKTEAAHHANTTESFPRHVKEFERLALVAAGSDDPLEAREAYQTLFDVERRSPVVVAAALNALFRNSRNEVKRIAIDLVSRYMIPGYEKELVRYAIRPDSALSGAAANAILELRTDAVAEALGRSLRRADGAARRTVLELLAEVGTMESVPYLINAFVRLPKITPLETRPLGRRYVAGVRAKVAPGAIGYEPIIKSEFVRTTGTGVTDEYIAAAETNEAIGRTLARITGLDLGPDKYAWQRWYAQYKKYLRLQARTQEE